MCWENLSGLRIKSEIDWNKLNILYSSIFDRSTDPELKFMCLKIFHLLTKLELPTEYPYLKDACGKRVVIMWKLEQSYRIGVEEENLIENS